MKWGVRRGSSKGVRLGKKEYGHVMHELMTNMTADQRAQQFVSKYIGDYLYKFRKEAEGIYGIIGKERTPMLLDEISKKKKR